MQPSTALEFSQGHHGRMMHIKLATRHAVGENSKCKNKNFRTHKQVLVPKKTIDYSLSAHVTDTNHVEILFSVIETC